MVGNPKWPPGDGENERRIRLGLLLCSFALFVLSVIQFALGLFVSLGYRILSH
ncbi:hypothetical protein [Methylacidimicrobium tartarophylax]|uniref:Uncharacterized protein n=1 Tax=Methylacidimicrobium tartarophylax TaxID=1041768 RepID=A0A5E6MJ50_9BACT|nr:hypothetical protein [Methylacidimicrobium tartarophylax]VVM08263.1 hypothetical protein MAMT_02238 [Methylacidimicrobium tartarophylax]